MNDTLFFHLFFFWLNFFFPKRNSIMILGSAKIPIPIAICFPVTTPIIKVAWSWSFCSLSSLKFASLDRDVISISLFLFPTLLSFTKIVISKFLVFPGRITSSFNWFVFISCFSCTHSLFSFFRINPSGNLPFISPTFASISPKFLIQIRYVISISSVSSFISF